MASAVSNVSKIPRKSNRAVFERPQKKAAPRAYVAENLLQVRSPALVKRFEDDLVASRSTPHFFKFNIEGTSASPRPQSKKTRTVAEPNSPGLLSPSPPPLSPLSADASAEDLVVALHSSGRSSINILSDGEESPHSPSTMGKNWKQMQVCVCIMCKRAPPSYFPNSCAHNSALYGAGVYTPRSNAFSFLPFFQEATFTNWINERLKGKQQANAGPHVRHLG